MIKNIFFLFYLGLLLSVGAQDISDSIPFVSQESDMEINKNLDSLMKTYIISKAVESPEYVQIEEPADSVIAEFPDSVYIARIKAMNSLMTLTYNSIVRSFIHVYTQKKRDKLEQILGLQEYYFPFFEQALDAYGLPLELRYLPVIESALNPRAVSRAGATGLWQFMYGTGKMYGLQVNSFVDERRDPHKSTDAACRFLKDLYDMFGDWILVIAAYNCGPNNVKKAIRRSGGKNDYWSIYYFLPRETRGYVPAFIAAMYAMNYHKEHNIKALKVDMNYPTDTIHIRRNLHFRQVADVLNISMEQLRDLNPQYRLDIIPGQYKTYDLRLPVEYMFAFIDLQDSIFAYQDSVLNNHYELLRDPQSFVLRNVHTAPSGNIERLYYTVKQGDNLGYISQWYNVRVSDLRHWNNIRGNTIHTGQKLVVYVPANKAHHYKKINNMSFVQKQQIVCKPIAVAPVESNSKTDSGGYTYYIVRPGDTLWSIAKKYPGVTEADILRLNNIADKDKIVTGQKLRIMKN